MLFNTYIFIFFFLPLALVGFHCLGRQGHHRAAIMWLVGMSLFFYSWWNPAYLALLIFSIIFNYSAGKLLARAFESKQKSKPMLVFGVMCNLVLLGYYKYADFFIENINDLIGSGLILHEVILPLAISFFTFQQIAYLVDAYKGESKEHNFLDYCLFVTFFPQLIAGPIVHHKEMLPQFSKMAIFRIRSDDFAVGLTIFILGIFKKVILADGISVFASPVFDAAESGVTLTFFEAWGGSIAYTLQLYFDFSGYSDMAIGLARMFGIYLPINFNSPYKATSIIEFWRRWHMTLSRFLRDYLYIALGGNRNGTINRYINLMITMILGGFWHGAGWTFIVWGTLHGLYLVINHLWRTIVPNPGNNFIYTILSWTLTFLAVVVSWVFFRADSIFAARSIIESMVGLNGISLSPRFANILEDSSFIVRSLPINFDGMFYNGLADWSSGWLIIIATLVLVAPNVQQIVAKYDNLKYRDEMERGFCWPNIEWSDSSKHALVMALLSIMAVFAMAAPSEFLYFRF